MCIDKRIAESEFALSLLKLLPVDQATVFSPLSISFALSLVHSGANGPTKQEILQTLLKGFSHDDLVSHFSSLVGKLQSAQEGMVFDIANRVYVKDGFPIKEEYVADITKHYQAKAENLDFDDGEAAAKVINEFVNDITHGKIEKIVNDDSFADAVAFLVNALYMKADWEHKFYGGMTGPREFHSAEGVTRQEDFMYDSEVNRDFFEDDQVQVLSLKYQDTSYRFNIILPKEQFGLAQVRDNLTGERLQELLSKVTDTFVTISMPKMKVEGDLSLVELLKSIGITSMFSDETADLTGIGEGGLFISDAKHKAVVEVDEAGTTAAAVTAMRVGVECMRFPGPVVFTADHPFIFVDEEGTTAAAVTMMKATAKCLRFPRPINFTADHPFIFVITRDSHTVFMGQYM